MKKIGILILTILSLMSCDKDDDEFVITKEVVFGNYVNMMVNYYDTILIGGYNNSQNLDIDINNDNIYDIRIISNIWGSPGLGQNPCSKIWSLNNNIEILGYFKTDTSFLNRSTMISPGANNITEIYEYYNHTCHMIDESDSILAVYENVFKISPKDKNERLSLDDTFKSDSITLIDDRYGFPFWGEEYGQDTVRYTVTSFYNDCNSFPLNEIKYIGLKILSDNSEKLGWIKLSIIDKYKILVLETAIQE